LQFCGQHGLRKTKQKIKEEICDYLSTFAGEKSSVPVLHFLLFFPCVSGAVLEFELGASRLLGSLSTT
jgi:hypothetical protein